MGEKRVIRDFWGRSWRVESKVLDYIRKNVTLDRIVKVEGILSDWWLGKNLLNLEDYIDWVLMESVYRGHKGSFKIDSSKVRGTAYLGLILYILFGEPKFEPGRHVLSRENKLEIRKVLKKHFESDSYFLRFSLNYLAIKTGDRDRRTGWIDIAPYVYPLLGGEIFYYCTLRALIEICKKALTDENYEYLPMMNWKEGIVDYLVGELVEEK